MATTTPTVDPKDDPFLRGLSTPMSDPASTNPVGPVAAGVPMPGASLAGGADPFTIGEIPELDISVGAPLKVRQAVGSAETPEDRLATIRMTYGDAQPFGEDNFVFTNPETGRPTLYNPEGFDFGDVASVQPELAEVFGGAVGAAAGLPAGPIGAVTGAGLGAAAGREMNNLLMSNVGGTVDTRGLAQRGADAATTAAVNSGGQMAGDALVAGGRAIVEGAKGLLIKPGAADRLADFSRAGVQPNAAAVAGSENLANAQKALADIPSSSPIITEAIEKTLRDIDQAAATLADEYGTATTRAEAGQALKDAGESYIARASKIGSDLYSNFDALIPKDTRVPVANVQAYLGDVAAKFADEPAIADILEAPMLKRFREALAGENREVTFELLKNLRSEVGRRLSRPAILVDENRATLEGLYAALSDDMADAAASAGEPAQRALKRANDFWQQSRKQIKSTIEPILRAPEVEDAFRRALSGSRDGASALLRLRRSMPADVWGDVAAVKIRELGLAKPGVQNATGDAFSATTFLTNLNKMSPPAQRVLFSGKGNGELFEKLQRLSRVAGYVKDAERMGANPSGTARATMWLQILGGGGIAYGASQDPTAAAAGAMASYLAPRYAARLMTSPKFVTWLTNAIQLDPYKKSLAPHIARLRVIAAEGPEMREAVREYMRALPAPALGNQDSGGDKEDSAQPAATRGARAPAPR